MAFIVFPDGRIQTNDAHEAIELSDLLQKRNASKPARQNVLQTPIADLLFAGPASPNAYESLVLLLNDNQKKALKLLQGRKRLTLEELRAALGVESNMAVGGVMSGVVKHAKRKEIDVASLFFRAKEGDGDERESVYLAGPALGGIVIK